MKLVVGVTGSIGSGKSTVCRQIRKMGYEVIDCDKIGHDILLSGHLGYTAVVEAFGTEVIGDEGIDRKKLGPIIWKNQAKRELLNQITHPIIKQEVIRLIEKNHDDIVFMECPLLFETDFIELCDKSIVVYSDMDNQIQRLMQRDGITFPEALNRIYAQMDSKEKMERADYIIDNCHSIGDLDWQIKQIIDKLKG